MPFINTRSYAALRAADLDWIIGLGYRLGGYILEKNHEKPTWSHEKSWKTNLKPWKTMKTNLEPWKTNLEPQKTMKTDLEPWKTNLEPWKTMKTDLEPWKTNLATWKTMKIDLKPWKPNLEGISKNVTNRQTEPSCRYTFRHLRIRGYPMTSRTQLEKVIIFCYTHFSSPTGGSNWPPGHSWRKWSFFVTHTFCHQWGDPNDLFDV